MRLPAAFGLLLAIAQHVPVQAEHGETGVLAHALADARVEQAHHRQRRWQAAKVELIHAGRQGEQHLQIRQQRFDVVRRLPGRQVLDIPRVADVWPGTPFDVRRVFGEQAPPVFAAYRVSFIEQGHGSLLA
ncbi:hypothetical protein D3C76_1023690 [compost metagenome]